MALKYKRILLKISGEALAGKKGKGFEETVVKSICGGVKACVDAGTQIAIVVGGGNFWRGAGEEGLSVERFRSDQIGMLGTAMNSLYLEDTLLAMGVNTLVQSAVGMQPLMQRFVRQDAVSHLKNNGVVIFACGTGSPYFSTDTAAALRAAEIEAEVIFKLTKVDGVYDSDPVKNVNAKKYDSLTFGQVIENNLKVMDMPAAAICRENNIKMQVLSIDNPDNMLRAAEGQNIGTLVCD